MSLGLGEIRTKIRSTPGLELGRELNVKPSWRMRGVHGSGVGLGFFSLRCQCIEPEADLACLSRYMLHRL